MGSRDFRHREPKKLKKGKKKSPSPELLTAHTPDPDVTGKRRLRPEEP